MTKTDRTPEQRRRVVWMAWGLAALVLFMLVTSIPFWKGLYLMAVGSE